MEGVLDGMDTLLLFLILHLSIEGASCRFGINYGRCARRDGYTKASIILTETFILFTWDGRAVEFHGCSLSHL